MRYELIFASVAVVFAVACSGGDNETFFLPSSSDNGDAGTSVDENIPDASEDSERSDAENAEKDSGAVPEKDSSTPNGDGAADAQDANRPLNGPQLLSAGNHLQVHGVTANDFAVYENLDTHTLHAVSLNGGTPVALLSNLNNAHIDIRGRAVFVWNNVDDNTSIGTGIVWSSAAGIQSLGARSIAGLAAATDDGNRVMYFRGATNNGTSADLVTMRLNSGNGTAIAADVGIPQVATSTCSPMMGSAGPRLLISYCAPSSTIAIVLSIDANGQKTTLLPQGESYWDADKAGNNIFVITSPSREGRIVDGTHSTTIDVGLADGLMLQDGSGLFYRTNAGTLKHANLSNLAATIVDTSVDGITALSPDGKFVSYYTQSNSDALSDLRIGSSRQPLVRNVVATPSATTYGDAFSSDSKFALYFNQITTSNETGTLNAYRMSDGNSRTVANNTWIVHRARGSKVLYNSNFSHVDPDVAPTGDIFVIDLAGSSGPVSLATAASLQFELSDGRDKAVYAKSAESGPNAGIWVAPIP